MGLSSSCHSAGHTAGIHCIPVNGNHPNELALQRGAVLLKGVPPAPTAEPSSIFGKMQIPRPQLRPPPNKESLSLRIIPESAFLAS